LALRKILTDTHVYKLLIRASLLFNQQTEHDYTIVIKLLLLPAKFAGEMLKFCFANFAFFAETSLATCVLLSAYDVRYRNAS